MGKMQVAASWTSKGGNALYSLELRVHARGGDWPICAGAGHVLGLAVDAVISLPRGRFPAANFFRQWLIGLAVVAAVRMDYALRK